jgi:hypothetical protein
MSAYAPLECWRTRHTNPSSTACKSHTFSATTSHIFPATRIHAHLNARRHHPAPLFLARRFSGLVRQRALFQPTHVSAHHRPHPCQTHLHHSAIPRHVHAMSHPRRRPPSRQTTTPHKPRSPKCINTLPRWRKASGPPRLHAKNPFLRFQDARPPTYRSKHHPTRTTYTHSTLGPQRKARMIAKMEYNAPQSGTSPPNRSNATTNNQQPISPRIHTAITTTQTAIHGPPSTTTTALTLPSHIPAPHTSPSPTSSPLLIHTTCLPQRIQCPPIPACTCANSLQSRPMPPESPRPGQRQTDLTPNPAHTTPACLTQVPRDGGHNTSLYLCRYTFSGST